MKVFMVNALLVNLKNLLRHIRKKMLVKKLPFDGYSRASVISDIDEMDNDSLARLNHILDWNCFTVDVNGRRFGSAAWNGKRLVPQDIPDRRIVLIHERFNLAGKQVLEVGCFEGVHTTGLLQFTDKVTAVDSRVDHVVKTMVRCGFYQVNPRVFQFNVEAPEANYKKLEADYVHHVGVLYHLIDPVSHLLRMGEVIKKGVMLDTHFSDINDANEQYEIDEESFVYKRYLEYGKSEMFSGMYEHSKWLTLDGIKRCLEKAGFNQIDVVEIRNERNGPRVLLFAERTD